MKIALPELTVLIGTCDNYSPLWKNFSILFDRYWNFYTRNIFIGETKEVPQHTNTKFETLTFNQSLTWGERMLAGIDMSSEKILFLLDDYFLSYRFTENTIKKYLQDFDQYQMDRLQISASGHQKYKYMKDIGYHKIKDDSDYLISMQPSIWRRSFLQKNLSPKYSPWDFEIKGSNKLKYSKAKIFSDQSISKNSTSTGSEIYYNAVRKGMKKNIGYEDFLLNHNLK